MEANLNINPEKWYSASSIVNMKILPWKSTMTFTGILRTESGQAIFKPLIRQCFKNRRYTIKGSSVLEFLRDKKGSTKI